jgi:DNA-binding IclR family transcriptional regulator
MATLIERHVLSMLRMGRARTQAQLCALTQQNSSTISELLQRLRRRGLIENAGLHCTGRGRPTAILRLAVARWPQIVSSQLGGDARLVAGVGRRR